MEHHPDHRGIVGRRETHSAARVFCGAWGHPMWFLLAALRDECYGATEGAPQSGQGGDHAQALWQPMPVHVLFEDLRCGGSGYLRFLGRWCGMKVLNTVGRRVPMHDAAAKATGQAQFTDDPVSYTHLTLPTNR